MRRFAISQIYGLESRLSDTVKPIQIEDKWGPALTYANLTILGAGGKVFSVGAEAHTPNVQIAIFVCFVINKNAVVQVRFK